MLYLGAGIVPRKKFMSHVLLVVFMLLFFSLSGCLEINSDEDLGESEQNEPGLDGIEKGIKFRRFNYSESKYLKIYLYTHM